MWWTWKAARRGSKPHYGPPASPISAIKQQKENSQTPSTQQTDFRINHTLKRSGGNQTVGPWQHPRLWASNWRGDSVTSRPECTPSPLPATRRAARTVLRGRGAAVCSMAPKARFIAADDALRKTLFGTIPSPVPLSFSPSLASVGWRDYPYKWRLQRHLGQLCWDRPRAMRVRRKSPPTVSPTPLRVFLH